MGRNLLLWILSGILSIAQVQVSAQFLQPHQVKETLILLQQSKADSSQVHLLLKLGEHHIFKTGEMIADLDSALELISKAEILSEQIKYPKGLGKSYLLYSEAFREKGEREKGMEYINKAIDLLKVENLYEELGDAYMDKRHYSSIYSTREELLTRNQIVEQAQEAYKKADNPLKQAKSLQESGDLSHILNDYRKAISVLKESLQLYESVDYQEVQGVYDLLGIIYTELDDTDEGLYYGLQAIKTAETVGDTTPQLSTIYNRVGLTYASLNHPEQAIEYFQKALSIAKKNDDQSSIVIINVNIVNMLNLLKKGKEALAFHQAIVKQYPAKERHHQLKYAETSMNIYRNLKQFDQGQIYCNQVLKIAKEIEKDLGYPEFTYNKIIRFFLSSGQYGEAQKYLPTFLETAESSGEASFLSIAHDLYFKLDSAQGNYQSALVHYQQHKAWEDSIINEKKNKQIALVEIQYETEKKDRELELKEKNIELLTQQSQLNQTQLQQAALTRNITLLGIGLLLLIVGLLYSRFRLKQRTNQQLKALVNDKDHLLVEKEWLLKEIHHRVKNNLQIIMSLLNTQSAYIQNDTALDAIRESQHRMQAMSLIHQRLYQSENIAIIDMANYIEDLLNGLKDSYDSANTIHFQKNVISVQLDVSQAVPLGLILNEAITNAMKYAFRGKEKGNITVNLWHPSENQLCLQIMDNGIGLPENFNITKHNSLGMSLIHGLSKQLEADLTIENKNGLQITICFPFQMEKSTYADAATNEESLHKHSTEMQSI